MSVATNNMRLSLNKVKNIQKEERWIEQDIIVPDNMPDALKIISVSAFPYISDVEISDGRVKVVGKINYLVTYRANDENTNIRGLNTSCPYSIIIDNEKIKDGSNILVESSLKNIIYSLPNERKIAIKNEIVYTLEIVENAMVDFIKDFPDNSNIEYSKCTNSFCNVKEMKQGYISSNENISISRESSPMYEILKYSYRIKDTDYKESYNKLLLKGILEITIIYLGEANKLCKEKVEVPFSGMVDTDNIESDANIEIKYIIRDLNIHINPDIEQKTLSLDFKIEYRICISENKEVEYVEDFYSKNSNLKYEEKTIEVASRNVDVTREISINDSISDIIPEGYKIIDYDLDTSNIGIQLLEDNIKLNGIAKLNVMLQNKENGELESRSLDVMVDESIQFEDSWKGSNINIKIKDKKLVVTQNGNSIDIKIVIYIDIDAQNVITINSIEKIEEEPIDLKDISSINIYVVKPGDSVWKIAKKYKTSMENIIRTNKLENPDLINIGEKILVIR